MFDSSLHARRLLFRVTAFASLMLASCKKSDNPVAPAVPSAIISIDGSDGQIGTAGQPLPRPLIVQVTDADGNAVVKANVLWSVASGGGTLLDSVTVTDDYGNTSNVLTLGPTAGADQVTASVPGVQSVTLNETAQDSSATSASLRKPNGSSQ